MHINFPIEVKEESFSVDGLAWKEKRADFAELFKEYVDGFFFCHGCSAESIAEFFSVLENLLGLSSKAAQPQLPFGVQLENLVYRKTSFSKTNRKSITWVMPSNFWLECPLRRSLFTALLRCACSYNLDKKNFEEALFSTNDTRNTRQAIFRFLFGFTRFRQQLQPKEEKDKLPGWTSIFSGKDAYFVRTALLRPSFERPESTPFHGIWTD